MENSNTTIHLDSGTIVKTIVFLAIFALLFFLRDIVLVILAAIIISSAIDPGVRWFERKKVPRALGVISIYLVMAALVLTLVLFVIPTFLSETSSVVNNIPKYVGQMNDVIPLLDQSALQGYVPIIKQLSSGISDASLSFSTSGSATSTPNDILNTATRVGTGAINIILIVVLSFYFSVTRDGVEYFLRIVTPAKNEPYILDLWARSKKKLGGWLQGQFLLGLLVGSLVYPMLAILGIKHALLLAVLAAFLELIPVFGPTLATVPAVLLALLDGGFILGLIVLGYYIIILQFENHVFYPLVVKKIIGISPLIVIIALVVGAKLAGVLGMLLSVPVSVILVEYIEDIDKRKKNIQK